MLNLNWNTLFNRIELSTGSKGAGKAFILFEGTSTKRVRVEKVVSGVGLELAIEISTCQTDNSGRNTPAVVPLAQDTSYVITPLSGASCTTQANTPFSEPDLLHILEPGDEMHAAVYSYHCHLADRDNVHITIVIEDASGGDPAPTPAEQAQSPTQAPQPPGNVVNEAGTDGTLIDGK